MALVFSPLNADILPFCLEGTDDHLIFKNEVLLKNTHMIIS